MAWMLIWPEQNNSLLYFFHAYGKADMITKEVSTMVWWILYLQKGIAYEDILGSINKRIARLIQVVYSV